MKKRYFDVFTVSELWFHVKFSLDFYLTRNCIFSVSWIRKKRYLDVITISELWFHVKFSSYFLKKFFSGFTWKEKTWNPNLIPIQTRPRPRPSWSLWSIRDWRHQTIHSIGKWFPEISRDFPEFPEIFRDFPEFPE